MKFNNDPKDRKRRFLRGLNKMLGLDYGNLEEDIPMGEILDSSKALQNFRESLCSCYSLELTPQELVEMVRQGISTGKFTEKYVPKVYRDRGNVNLNVLLQKSTVIYKGRVAIDPMEMDKAPKYGLNGSTWCDVAEGPCSCGAWH
jgi:hypothetical protein